MKVAAIIAEYNPFHKGHAYHIEKTRELTGADYVLVVMSGDFVQRGTPAIINKYVRTKAALLSGADAILELPLPYAVSSAEFFAQGGVCLLERLGCVDFLSFGSECGEIDRLSSFADILISEPPIYKDTLSGLLKRGISYPIARCEALKTALNNDSCKAGYPIGCDTGLDAVDELLGSPNNILALEYLKALKQLESNICPVTVKRCGEYHDPTLTAFSSATAIRQALIHKDPLVYQHLPEGYETLLTEETGHTYLDSNDFSLLLYYKLLSEKAQGFSDYLDCNREISDKIIKHLPKYRDFTSFCDLLKSKHLTYTRISRVLLHILLNIKTPADYLLPMGKRSLSIPYVRLLGFQKQASGLLNHLKSQSTVPLISNIPGAADKLDENGAFLLSQNIAASDLYEAVFSQKSGISHPNEYQRSPIIL